MVSVAFESGQNYLVPLVLKYSVNVETIFANARSAITAGVNILQGSSQECMTGKIK